MVSAGNFAAVVRSFHFQNRCYSSQSSIEGQDLLMSESAISVQTTEAGRRGAARRSSRAGFTNFQCVDEGGLRFRMLW